MNRLTDRLWRRWQQLYDWIMPVPPPAPRPMATTPTARHELFEQLATLRERRRMEAEGHRIEVDELTGQWKILQAQADNVHHQINRLQHADLCRSLDASAAEDRLLAQIKEKSSMSLQLFVEEMNGELNHLNRTEAVALPSAHRDYAIGKKTMGLETDAPSRLRRATALHAARAKAVAMQCEPMTVEAMNRELIRLRRSIPAVTSAIIHGERASIVAYN